MNILLSNDDGYRATGLLALHEAVSKIADVVVVAPDRNRSGTGSSLTLHRTLEISAEENGFLAVDGTPADCVMLALTDLLDRDPDMVVSGINHGANLGDDVLYSGTVGAALEGRVLNGCSIAVSLATDFRPLGRKTEYNFETAASVTVEIIGHLLQQPLHGVSILNVNVPDVTRDEITGWEVTRLGSRARAQSAPPDGTNAGQSTYKIGPAGVAVDDGFGTDFNAIANNRVSITPIKVDRTENERMKPLQNWLAESALII